jgi:hypothetical protein
VAALIRARYPRLTPVQVELAMTSSATHRPRGGYSPGTGFGEVDASAALAAAGRLAAAPARPGLAANGQFARPGPIQVAHRNVARITGYVVAAAVFVLAFLALVAVLAVRIRRLRRSRGQPAGPAQPEQPGPSEQFAESQ